MGWPYQGMANDQLGAEDSPATPFRPFHRKQPGVARSHLGPRWRVICELQNTSVSTDLFPRANSLPSRLCPHETIRSVTVSLDRVLRPSPLSVFPLRRRSRLSPEFPSKSSRAAQATDFVADPARFQRGKAPTSPLQARYLGPASFMNWRCTWHQRGNPSVTVDATLSECACPRAQQAPNRLMRPLSVHLSPFPSLLRPGTGALRQGPFPPSLTHYPAHEVTLDAQSKLPLGCIQVRMIVTARMETRPTDAGSFNCLSISPEMAVTILSMKVGLDGDGRMQIVVRCCLASRESTMQLDHIITHPTRSAGYFETPFNGRSGGESWDFGH